MVNKTMSKKSENAEMEVQDNILVIKIRLDQTLGLSASGKSTLIATTRGNKELSTIVDGAPEKVYISVNCYTK